MKPITLLFTVLLAVAGFGAGLLVGRQHAPSSASTAPTAATGAASNETPLPAVNVKTRATAASNKSGPDSGRMSLAEVEAALLELPKLSRSKVWERLNEIAKAVDPADIPQVLAFATKLPNDIQSSIRYSLVARWAETDPRAAMEFAGNIKNFNERNQTILSVLRGWAKDDATEPQPGSSSCRRAT
ncbi:MAG: hypothetical protein U1F83_19330 [Verrucomicrobiota bacterium]